MDNMYYQMTVPAFTRSLTNLKLILEKAEIFIKEHNISEADLFQKRLAPDMLPFVAQVQIASDNAKGGVGRLAGVEIPNMEDNEKTLPELIERIDKTIAFLGTVKPEQFLDAGDRRIHLHWMPEGMSYTGVDYLTQFLLANFYFHYTTAYDILRQAGLTVGKSDFIGQIPMVKD
jgi:hypothetical protein